MDLALQVATKKKIEQEETTQVLKGFKSQSLVTQGKTGEELVAMLLVFKKWP